MNTLIIITAIIQSLGASLGVGSSTLAITNFFVALSDGHIDKTERKMMGVVYIVLRVAMVVLLVSTAILTGIQYRVYGTAYFTPFVIGFWILIFILFANAILMTFHKIPNTFGPALQAGTWYSIGILMSLFSLSLYNFSFAQFCLGYASVITFSVLVIHCILSIVKKKN